MQSQKAAVLKVRLRQAAVTLAALPRDPHERPCQMRSAWPDIIHDTAPFVLQPRGQPRFVPNPLEIDRMNEIFDWLSALDPGSRTLVWARACKVPWSAL